MDEDRKIRFLVAPLILLSSLGWGMWVDPMYPKTFMYVLRSPDSTFGIGQVITILAGGSIVIFTFGVVIGTFTYVFIRCCFTLCPFCKSGVGPHEICVTKESLDFIWKRLKAPGTPKHSDMFFAGITFDHGILQQSNPGIHSWIVRRWNAFSIAVTSAMGLVFSLILGICMGVQCSTEWLLPVAVLFVVFCVSACWSWRDTMGMLNFQATLPVSGQKEEKTAE